MLLVWVREPRQRKLSMPWIRSLATSSRTLCCRLAIRLYRKPQLGRLLTKLSMVNPLKYGLTLCNKAVTYLTCPHLGLGRNSAMRSRTRTRQCRERSPPELLEYRVLLADLQALRVSHLICPDSLKY